MKWLVVIVIALLLMEGILLWTFYQFYTVSRSTHIQSIISEQEEVVNEVMAEEVIVEEEIAEDAPEEVIEEEEILLESVQIEVNPILQLPELARGCEVTSLAMLLSHAGIEVSKMTLAEEIVKNPIPITYRNGKVYAGDMNDGFLGDIYTFEKDGLGVYHKPIHQLAQQYLGDAALDISGSDFEDVYLFLSRGYPVWIITTSTFSPLPESSFQTWYTPDETPMRVTYREHSVLITGYDQDYIYFNDPLSGHAKKDKENFIAAWEQMGKQAVSYLK